MVNFETRVFTVLICDPDEEVVDVVDDDDEENSVATLPSLEGETLFSSNVLLLLGCLTFGLDIVVVASLREGEVERGRGGGASVLCDVGEGEVEFLCFMNYNFVERM